MPKHEMLTLPDLSKKAKGGRYLSVEQFRCVRLRKEYSLLYIGWDDRYKARGGRYLSVEPV